MARTADQLTASEEVMIGELDGIANNSVIYKNDSGAYSAVSLGTSGKVLQSNGATSAPTFETVSGSAAGSDQQFQFNSSGSFAGTDNIKMVAGITTNIKSNNVLFIDAVTPTKTAKFDLSGQSSTTQTIFATSGTADRTYTFPNASGTLLLSGGALGTPSSGTLTNCTSLPISGLTASTSTAIGVGSIELGHASDTTLSRVSAGKVAVEGVTLLDTTNISDTAYGAGWNGDTTNAPSKNAVYDKIESMGAGGITTADAYIANRIFL